MKITEEKGTTATKVIIILLLIVLLVGGVVTAIFFIKGKSNKNSDTANQIDESTKEAERLEYIETIDDEDIYIGTNGKITKIDTAISKKESEIFKNSILIKNEEEQEYLVDCNMNKITEPGQYKSYSVIVQDEQHVLYQVANNDYKKGVINEKGEVIVPCENEEYFRYIADGYFYIYNTIKSADEYKYEYVFYDETGKKVYTKILDKSDLYIYPDKVEKLRNGALIVFIELKENELYAILNVSTGEVVEEIKMSQKHNVDLSVYGNMLYAQLYEGTLYGEKNNMIRICYWFGDDKKLIKSQQLTDEYIDTRPDVDVGCVVMSKNGKGTAYKGGEVIYSSDSTFSTYEHYDKKSNSYTPYFVESYSGRKYATYNSKGEKIMDNKVFGVGNKYLKGSEVLYNFDGSVAKENVSAYEHVAGIDFIKTQDGVVMENGEISKKINVDVFSAEHIREVNDDYVYLEFKERLFIINQKTLDYAEIEAENSSDYWLVQNGYVKRGNKYYNLSGKQVYEKKS
ncbi:MAG: hypothetical protein J6J36_07210 [Clostridia bacterium]|nr:hypothetical protein [Clostridia bacterium]